MRGTNDLYQKVFMIHLFVSMFVSCPLMLIPVMTFTPIEIVRTVLMVHKTPVWRIFDLQSFCVFVNELITWN